MQIDISLSTALIAVVIVLALVYFYNEKKRLTDVNEKLITRLSGDRKNSTNKRKLNPVDLDGEIE